MSVTVKICGITRVEDAVAAARAGADALGFMFFPQSPRFVSFESAARICRELGPFPARVGVFVDPSEEEVSIAMRECGLNILQFHGNESPEFCRGFGAMSMKAFRIRGPESLTQLSQYKTDAWLLDSHVDGVPGGTGAKFNWDLAVEARKMGRPIFLAGGLNPDNVAEAIRRVRPYGVDVSSGVESAPGIKDAAKVTAFVSAAKEALERIDGACV
jgi:phosphoribosylanthranilate isomerase